ENISVLKGPNASALYGSRANNGVVMITTKKGKAGEGYGVTFNSSVGLETVNKLPKMQKLYGGGYGGLFEKIEINGQKYDYADMYTDESWGPKYEGQTYISWYDLAKWEQNGKKGNPTTSIWQTPVHDFNDFFETGVSFTNNISVSQATERASARVSYTNTDLKGYLPNSSQQKNVFNVAATMTSADKKLEAFTNVTYFNSRAKGRSEIGYGDNNVMVKFVQWGHRELDMRELKDIYIMPGGTQATWNRSDWDDPTPAYSNNPYWTRYLNYQNDSRNRIYGNVGLSYKILPELKFQYKANLDFFVDKQYERNAVYSQEMSKYREISRQQYELNNEFLLMYNKSIDDFSINVNAGGNIMKRNYEYVYGETSGGLAIPLFYNLKNSVSQASAYNLQRKKAINSVFGNATLGWKNRLYVDASLRNDWSSTLPQGSNSYLYPSVTGSFIFSELLKDASWLSFGKVRLGYAMVGNDTDPYQVIDTYSQYTNIDSSTSTPGYVISSVLNNKDLKPETTNSYEIGLEMNFFDNRLGFEATYYMSETKNQIIPLSVSGSTGYRERVINSGLITNKGVEFTLHGTPVKTHDFSWETTLTLASNKNKVKELVEGVNYYRLTTAPFRVEIGAIKGESYGVIMGTDYIYDEKTGEKVITEEGLYAATDGNVNLGGVYPDFTGGWSNTFKYKNLDLSVLVDFSRGGHYFSTTYMWGMYSGMIEESAANQIREEGILLKGVQADGTPNTIVADGQLYSEDFYTGPAAQSVLKSDYIKLREVNLGYTFPLKNKYFIKSLRLSAYGRNLGVWGPDVKHFDPEMVVSNSGNVQGIEGGAIAAVASYGFNVSLKF
ncbi:TonB-dependent receptor SusC, partial [termite gut metagenome]